MTQHTPETATERDLLIIHKQRLHDELQRVKKHACELQAELNSLRFDNNAIEQRDDLLAALKELLSWAENQCCLSGNDEAFGREKDHDLVQARAAIAKATGG